MARENTEPAPGAAPSELDQLAGVAAATDAGAAMPQLDQTGAPVAPINYGAESAAAVAMFAGLLTGYCPATAPLWDQATQARVSITLAPVLEKYGITVGTLPCELLLIVTAGPLLYQSARLVATQMAAEKKAAKEAAPADATPGADAGPEQLRHPQTALYP
jgi:hypothetical protein